MFFSLPPQDISPEDRDVPCPPLLGATLDQALAGWQLEAPLPGQGVQNAALILPGEPFIKIQTNKEAQDFKNPLGGCFCVTMCALSQAGSQADTENAGLLIINSGI